MSKNNDMNNCDIDIQPEAVSGEVVDLKRDIPRIAEEIALNDLHCDDITKLPQGQFDYVLSELHDKYLIYDNNIYNKNNHVKNCDHKREYKDSVLLLLYELYVKLCKMYNKHINVYGYSCFTGINYNTIYQWEYEKKASHTKKEISKNLDFLDEQTITNKIISLNNPVGLIAYQNNKHGWNTQTIRHEHDTTPATTAALAEQLGLALPEKS